MKLLTVNFITCAVKTCKSSAASFPLHFKDAELQQVEVDFNPTFLRNILPRVDWEALKIYATEVGRTFFFCALQPFYLRTLLCQDRITTRSF